LIVSHKLGGTQKLLGRLVSKGWKFEYRNTKFETNSNFKYSKFKTSFLKEEFWSFEIRILVIVSDFEVRISDLKQLSLAYPYKTLVLNNPNYG